LSVAVVAAKQIPVPVAGTFAAAEKAERFDSLAWEELMRAAA